jgi:hypothetical protein
MQDLRRRVRAERSLLRFEPCLPRAADAPPAGPGWIHEIKHDGFRILGQKDGTKVRLITRNGHDFTERYPLIVDAVRSLPGTSCVIDGEAIVVDQDGLSVFDFCGIGGTITPRPCARSISSRWTAGTCGDSRSRNARISSGAISSNVTTGSPSTTPSMVMAV